MNSFTVKVAELWNSCGVSVSGDIPNPLDAFLETFQTHLDAFLETFQTHLDAFLETFQTHLDAFRCHLLQVTLPWQGVGWVISRGPSSPDRSVIL
ncbi:hypothetical protein DUI87_15682 [Hirundo rustica rustica]|uniref:Uncharacterized protein n=1 Tax=Hirundo rustica rustica TaxID=333673 RepID=A0A3M0K1P9_HIRRU|nr:hypothetical protein DUI87_15682 [Hirundo rustica rustica]